MHAPGTTTGKACHVGTVGEGCVSSANSRPRDQVAFIPSVPIRLRISRLAALALVALALIATGEVRAQGSDAFRRFLETLWPEAQAMGISRATFDQALRGVEPDLTLPDLVLPGKRAEGAGRIHQDAGRVSERGLSRQARRAGQGAAGEACRTRSTRSSASSACSAQFVLAIWGRETAFGAHRSPHYAVQVLATQAYLGRRKEHVPQRAPARAEDAAGRRAHARDHELVVGRRHGPHAVHAVGILHAGLRSRRRRPQGHLGTRCPMPWGRPPTSCAPRAGCPDQSWGYEVRLPQGHLLPARKGPTTPSRCASG